MKTPTPTLEEYRQLYEAALAFKEEAPWEWMTEDQVFGVRDPETGEIGYASIMGMLGEHLALALYLGSAALEGFWRVARGLEQCRDQLAPREVAGAAEEDEVEGHGADTGVRRQRPVM